MWVIYVTEDNDSNVEVMITQLIWITWTLMFIVRDRLLNLITHSLVIEVYPSIHDYQRRAVLWAPASNVTVMPIELHGISNHWQLSCLFSVCSSKQQRKQQSYQPFTRRIQYFSHKRPMIQESISMSSWNQGKLADVQVHLHKVHLHRIRDPGLITQAQAWMQSKRLNWCFMFTLIGVQDFCHGRPCLSLTLHVAISSDADVWVRLRLCIPHPQTACSHGQKYRLLKWLLPRMTSDPSLGCSINTNLLRAWTRTRTQMLGQCKCKCKCLLLWCLK